MRWDDVWEKLTIDVAVYIYVIYYFPPFNLLLRRAIRSGKGVNDGFQNSPQDTSSQSFAPLTVRVAKLTLVFGQTGLTF